VETPTLLKENQGVSYQKPPREARGEQTIIEKEPDVDEGQYDREESYQDYSHFAKRESKWMLQLRLCCEAG